MCVGCANSIEILGKVVGTHGISIHHTHIQSFRNYVRPVSQKQMISFLGYVNFYHVLILSLAMYSKSVSLSLTKTHPTNIVWKCFLSLTLLCLYL